MHLQAGYYVEASLYALYIVQPCTSGYRSVGALLITLNYLATCCAYLILENIAYVMIKHGVY